MPEKPTKERRKAPRVKVNLPVRWEGVLTQQTATVTSLSESGCFVLTGGKVEPKELIRLEIELPDGDPVYFWSEVVDEAFDIGFAVRFTSASDEEKVRLARVVRQKLAQGSGE
ncbi:MAG: PilZ domain-containing protein [Acidobacteriota bacterium]